MIKFENTDVSGWDAAIRGMRNPLNSWKKSDSRWMECADACSELSCAYAKQCEMFATNGLIYVIGDNDLTLMKKLIRGGTDHSKFLRMINVTVDIIAPRYWWTEFDTYKVGTVRNSCSTMHKIHDKEFTMDDFSYEHLDSVSYRFLFRIIDFLNKCRENYNGVYAEINGKKECWWQMIQLLPQSYNQRATVQMNYQVLRTIYHSERKHHKLDEWRIGFMEWIESLPYAELITGDFF